MRRFVLTAALCFASTAWAGEVDDFVAACGKSTNLEPNICQCTGEKAKADLSADGYAFLVASLNEDTAKTEELRGKLPLPELMKASMFMTKGPAACAKKLGGGAED